MTNNIRILLFCIIIVLSFPSFVLAAKTHKVKKNETIYSLAQKYHVTVEELKSTNNLVSNHIKPKDVLIPIRFDSSRVRRAP